jgi:UDP-N-acetylmuramyl pentapeptide synthase
MCPVELDDGVTFIRDEWKAPYWSIPSSLEFMRTACAKRKVIVLGTISDYRGRDKKKYYSIARQALGVADHVFFVGQNTHHILKIRKHPGDETLNAFETVKKAADFLQYFLMPGDLVLLKGSNRADHLTRIILTRNRKVACWRNRCNRQIFCDHCALLRVPSFPHTNIKEDWGHPLVGSRQAQKTSLTRIK